MYTGIFIHSSLFLQVYYYNIIDIIREGRDNMRRLEELTRNEFDQLKKTIDEKYEGIRKRNCLWICPEENPVKNNWILPEDF